MQPETIRQTVRLFEGEPDKARSKPTVKAHTAGAQSMEKRRREGP